MRKLVTESFGSLDDLVVVEAPDLEPAPGQVVVDVDAAGVNFVDGLIVQGRYQFTPPLPHTPGTEVAGTSPRSVTASTGSGPASGSSPCRRPAATRRRSPCRPPAVVPIPDSITAGQAAGLVQSYATMLYAFTRRTTVTADEWIVVLGAGGGVGLAATDLGTALGAHVVACASTRRQAGAGDGGRCRRDDRLRGRRPEGGDPRRHRRRRRRRRRPGRRRQGRVGAAQPALGGPLPRDRVRRRRHPPLPDQPDPAQQPHRHRHRARRLGAARPGRLPRPDRRADGPRRRRHRAPRRAAQPAARGGPRAARRDAGPRPSAARPCSRPDGRAADRHRTARRRQVDGRRGARRRTAARASSSRATPSSRSCARAASSRGCPSRTPRTRRSPRRRRPPRVASPRRRLDRLRRDHRGVVPADVHGRDRARHRPLRRAAAVGRALRRARRDPGRPRLHGRRGDPPHARPVRPAPTSTGATCSSIRPTTSPRSRRPCWRGSWPGRCCWHLPIRRGSRW